MPYRRILEELLALVPGSRTALLLDAQGEVVVGAGDMDERHRLIGAYQGIALQAARRTGGRYLTGEVRSMHCRYAGGQVVLVALKDGYYVILALRADASGALGLRRAHEYGRRLDAEL